MCVLSHDDILEAMESGRLVIESPLDLQVRENGIDLHVSNEILSLPRGSVVSRFNLSKVFNTEGVRYKSHTIMIEPGRHYLLRTVEKITLPDDIIGLVGIRSTYARMGLVVPPTVVDAGFSGTLTIEVVSPGNTVVLYPPEAIIHLVLFRTCNPSSKTYNGVYQGQVDVQPPVEH